MARMSMSSYKLRERKECGRGVGSGGVECNGRKAGADTTVRWRRNESKKRNRGRLRQRRLGLDMQ